LLGSAEASISSRSERGLSPAHDVVRARNVVIVEAVLPWRLRLLLLLTENESSLQLIARNWRGRGPKFISVIPTATDAVNILAKWTPAASSTRQPIFASLSREIFDGTYALLLSSAGFPQVV
jgi:hypothetical protein